MGLEETNLLETKKLTVELGGDDLRCGAELSSIILTDTQTDRLSVMCLCSQLHHYARAQRRVYCIQEDGHVAHDLPLAATHARNVWAGDQAAFLGCGDLTSSGGLWEGGRRLTLAALNIGCASRSVWRTCTAFPLTLLSMPLVRTDIFEQEEILKGKSAFLPQNLYKVQGKIR